MYPEVFTEKTKGLFELAFNLSKGKANIRVLEDTRRLLEMIMLRRLKSSTEVNLDLPPKTEVLLYIPLTEKQKRCYEYLLSQDRSLFTNLSTAVDSQIPKSKEDSQEAMKPLSSLEIDVPNGQDKPKWHSLQNLLMQLRKCCNHLFLLDGNRPEESNEDIILDSGKAIVLEKLLCQLVKIEGKKVIIFSGFTSMLDICESVLSLCGGGIGFGRLDGNSSRARRSLNIRLFNDMTNAMRVMLISTRAGGSGITLTAATEVIFLDQDYNPQQTLQAEARAHRIGQTKPVTVYKLVTRGTVEEQMMSRIRKKLYLAAKVTESMRNLHRRSITGSLVPDDEDADEEQSMSTSQLMAMITCGAEGWSESNMNASDMMNMEYGTMIEKLKASLADEDAAGEDRGTFGPEEEKAWLSKIEQISSRSFEGKEYQKDKDEDVLMTDTNASQPLDRADRRKGKATTVMIDGYAVSKYSIGCAEDEAVPTLAGKNASLAYQKRAERAKFSHEAHCIACLTAPLTAQGDFQLCSKCPRAYHMECLSEVFQEKTKRKLPFLCPQHTCSECGSSTGQADGLIYRCRWCDKGFCDSCLNFEKAELHSENLEEFELLGYPDSDSFYFIVCPSCVTRCQRDRKSKKRIDELSSRYSAEYERFTEAGESHDTLDQTNATPSTVPEYSSTPALTTAPSTAPSTRLPTPSYSIGQPRRYK